MGKVHPRTNHPLLRQLGLLLALPVVVMGGSFALFNQNLSVNASTASVAYVSTQYTTVTYTKTMTGTGPYTYTFNPMVIKNNGVTSITAWRVTFDLPPGIASLTCPGTVVCTQNATTVTITNGAGNGTILPGATTSFSFSFSSTAANYSLQNVTISATYAVTYETISGLTVVATKGSKKGGKYPLTVTITNSSGQSISGWQVTVPVTATCTSTVPAGITYSCTTTVLTYTGAAISIASGAQYQFSTSVTYGPNSWVTTGAAVKGKA